MTEFHIGQRVRFMPGAAVSSKLMKCEGVVLGYEVNVTSADKEDGDSLGGESDRVDACDYVVVSVNGCEQWVLPREIEPVTPAKGAT